MEHTLMDTPRIQKARRMPALRWPWIQDLIEESDDPDEKAVLEQVMLRKYHIEEFLCQQ